jgi:hypothetical protein
MHLSTLQKNTKKKKTENTRKYVCRHGIILRFYDIYILKKLLIQSI